MKNQEKGDFYEKVTFDMCSNFLTRDWVCLRRLRSSWRSQRYG